MKEIDLDIKTRTLDSLYSQKHIQKQRELDIKALLPVFIVDKGLIIKQLIYQASIERDITIMGLMSRVKIILGQFKDIEEQQII